jgi:hypothetical protein
MVPVWLAAVLLVGAAVALGRPAHAHAIVKAESLDDSTLRPNTAATLVLRFNAAIHANFSRVHLLNVRGEETLLKTSPGPSPNTLTVEFPALPVGAYALRYRVLAADGHYSDNKLRFRILGE